MNTAESELPPTSLSALVTSLPQLREIEDKVQSCLASEASTLTEISEYLLKLGGKRIRPALCLLVARALGKQELSNELRDVASGIELIHMATLLHDDIIDKSPKRRHSDSAYLKFGLPDTLLTGDFLLVRAFALCANLDEYIIAETERACIELTEGEILERPLFVERVSQEQSLNIATKKTASLFRLAGLSAAHLSGASEEVKNLFGVFAESAGLAFQILDDILDVTADEDLLGKKTGTDIRERKPSIVNVLWLESDSQLSNGLLEAPSDVDGLEEQFVADAIAELSGPQSAVIDECRKLAQSYAETSLGALDELNKQGVAHTAELELLVRAGLKRLS